MKRNKPFLYKTVFNNFITASEKVGENKFDLSNASLKNLHSLLPVDINKDDTELLNTFYNGAVANRFNLNDDGIDSKTAIAIAKYFKNKPTDLEHKTKDIVGHIINYGFSSFDEDNKTLQDKDILESAEPFNMSFCCVVYKNVDQDFAELLYDSSNELSENYKKISTSWEIGFNQFNIAIGPTRDLKDCEIISDPEEKLNYIKYLKAFGGNGKLEDGRYAMRLIVGDVYPLGFGYTRNPAADVKGVSVIDCEDMEDEGMNFEKIEIEKKNNSQVLESNVNQKETNIKDMEILEEIKKLIEAANSKEKSFSQESVASLAKNIADNIAAKNEDYKIDVRKVELQKEELEKAKAELEQKVKEISAKSEELQKTLEENSKELQTIKASEEARKLEDLFNGRMEELDSIYDFDSEEKALIVKDVAALASTDEAFNEFKARAAILFKKNSKAFKKEEEEKLQKAIQEKVAEASAKPKEEEVKLEKAIASIEPKDAVVPNSTEESKNESSFEKLLSELKKDGKIKATIK
jgi:hypothetical protein